MVLISNLLFFSLANSDFFLILQSAVNHDLIMNAHEEEKVRLEEEASRVAQRAAEALRHSRMLRSREDISVPTWTGKSGTAGAPSSSSSSSTRKFGSTVNSKLFAAKPPARSGTSNLNGISAGASAGKALSSADLLARIRGNQERAAGAGTTTVSRSQPEVLVRQISTFMQQRGGSTDSSTIVQHFRERIPSEDLPLFKNLLKEIAVLEKNLGGSVWVLKQEYR